MHGIQKINQNGLCFKGKFILANNLSESDIKSMNKFGSYILDKKCNADIIKNKSYDIYAEKGTFNPNMLTFWASFDSILSGKKHKIFISSFNLKNTIRNEIRFFRSELNWFERLKELSGGYNNFCEKIRAFFKNL